MFAYPFNGYWKDVGTIESYWNASMDILCRDARALDLFEDDWKIYAADYSYPPQYIGKDAKVKMSMIADGCTVLGDVENSILSQGVYVGENAKIKDSVILGNVSVEAGALVNRCVVNSRSNIKAGSIVGNGKNIILYSGDGLIE